MLSKLLRQLLFYLIHLVMDVLVAGQKFCQQFYAKKYILPVERAKPSDIEILISHRTKITKRLNHVALLADTENHSYSDLAQVVIWGLLAGIPYVSFHDITGELKENEDKLFLEVERFKKGIPGCIKWSNKPNLNGYTNGSQAHTVNVNIFSYSDGKQRIAQCIRKISQMPPSSRISELSAQDLDEYLSLVYPSIPDPDLVVYTGLVCCTHGFLPWQIRLTEFICLSLDHSISIESFIGALYKYNKCDQRFGK